MIQLKLTIKMKIILLSVIVLWTFCCSAQCDTTKRGFLLAEVKGKVQFIGACKVKCHKNIFYIDAFTKKRLVNIKILSFSDGS